MRSGLTNSSSLRCGSSGRQCLDELAEGSVALRVLDLSPTTRSQTLQLSSTPTITAIKPRGASPTRATAAFGTLCRSLTLCCHPAAFLPVELRAEPVSDRRIQQHVHLHTRHGFGSQILAGLPHFAAVHRELGSVELPRSKQRLPAAVCHGGPVTRGLPRRNR